MMMRFTLLCLSLGSLASVRLSLNIDENGEVRDEDYDDEDEEDFGVRGGGAKKPYSATRSAPDEEAAPALSRAGALEKEATRTTMSRTPEAEAAPVAPAAKLSRDSQSLAEMEQEMQQEVQQPQSLSEVEDAAVRDQKQSLSELEDAAVAEDRAMLQGDFEDHDSLLESHAVKGDRRLPARRRLPADWKEKADPEALAALHSLLEGDHEDFARYINSLPDEGDVDDHGSLLEDFEHYEVKGDRRRLPADWTPPDLDSLLEEKDFEDHEEEDEEEYFDDFEDHDSLLESHAVKGDRRRLPADWKEKADPEALAALHSLLEGDEEHFAEYLSKLGGEAALLEDGKQGPAIAQQ